MKKIREFLQNINIDYVFYVLLIAFFIFALFFSTYRDAIRDETIYIHETYLLSELIKNGIWFGDYAVGLHGFLFKIPPAILFIFTGPSVALLTIYNILIATGVGYFLYRFLQKAFNWKATALLITGFVMANFHFILSTPTYLREMPSLLIIILFLYGILKNWKPWVLGIVLLLLLDAKEYLFFMFGSGYFIWVVIKYFRLYETLYSKIKYIILECIQLYILPLFWIVLMFTTSIIPVNMFVASILGLVDTGLEYTTQHFSADVATQNLLEGGTESPRFYVSEDYPIFLQYILNFLNSIISYIGKIFYPRTFSFLAIPKVIILPAVYMGFKVLKDSWKKKLSEINKFDLILPILMFVYLIIYLLRATHGRYLLPIAPVVGIYFVYFLYYGYHEKRALMKVLLATLVFVVIGFFFEMGYVPQKVILELSLFACIAISVMKPFNFGKDFYLLFKIFTIGLCVAAMFGASVLFAATQGQAKHSTLFGNNREIDNVVEMVPEDSRFWINNHESYDLMAVYIGQTYSWPEWKWQLAPYVPKKTLLQTYGEKYAFNKELYKVEDFWKYVSENDIEYVVLMKSKFEDVPFQDQEYLEDFKETKWLEKYEKQDMKGKEIYVFEVIYDL